MRAGGRGGPYYLVLPALLLLYGLVFLFRHGGRGGAFGERVDEGALPAILEPDAISVFTGEADLGGGGRLVARLSPLHPAEGWQRFDAQALRRRLSLPPGEPWRLELLLEGSEGVTAAVVPLVVLDAEGKALSGLTPSDAGRDGGEPADPLRVLLDGGSGPLAEGEEVQLVLWGRPPGRAPRIEAGGEAPWVLALEPVEIPTSALPRHLARIGRDGEGEGR